MGTGFRHDVVVQRGAGAYICGEETGLLESLEGKKGQPRKKPPFPAQYGAFGMPDHGEQRRDLLARAAHRRERRRVVPRLRHREEPGHDASSACPATSCGRASTSCRSARASTRSCSSTRGGVPNGRKVKGVIPGGMSMPILPADQLDVPMANEHLRERKTMLGTGGIMVMDETTCMVRVASVITYFFRDESCGQCTQCREGTGWMNKIVNRIERGAGNRGRPRDPARRGREDGGPDDLRVRRRGGLAGAGAAAPLPLRLRGARAREALPVPGELRALDAAHHRRRNGDRGRGGAHAAAGARRRRAAHERRRRPALLLAPEALDRRLLPAVPGGDRGRAEAPDRLQHAGAGRHGRAHAAPSACSRRAKA